MTLNRLVREQTDDEGNTIYVMIHDEVEVKATQNFGLAPVITYWIKDQEITDDIRNLRFSPNAPGDYIVNYDAFQTMIYNKEQQAINDLYERYSIKPKNMTTGKQILWSIFVLFLIALPIFVVLLIKG